MAPISQLSKPPATDVKSNDADDGDEDDYMNMIFDNPTNALPPKESSLQRRARLKREAEARSRIPSKKEKEAAEAAAREEALSQTLDSSNKGFKMLAKLGYKAGSGLGKASAGAPEPISVTIKDDRGGIGKDSDKKRKLQNAVESASKKVKETQEEYRDRVRSEHLEKRLEGQLFGAQKIAEKLDTETDAEARAAIESNQQQQGTQLAAKPLKGMNILWRGVARERIVRERDRRMKHDMLQSGPRLGTFVDPDEDTDDKLALGKSTNEILEEEVEEDDAELEAFIALPVAERLEQVVKYLRDSYHYCFWCKFQYPDESMDGCPGLTEDDHD